MEKFSFNKPVREEIMKKMHFFNLLLVSILLTPSAVFCVQKSNWKDQPLLKRSVSKDASQAKNGKKNSELKETLNWYKKPAALYAAGGLLSVAAGAYAIFKYMQGDTSALVEVPEENNMHVATDDSKADSVNSVEQNNQNKTINDDQEAQEKSSEPILSDEDKVAIDKSGPINAIVQTACAGTVLIGAGMIVYALLQSIKF